MKSRLWHPRERGFALALMFPLLGALLLCLFFFFRQAHMIVTDKESRGACRVELLKAQTQVGISLEKLLRLNGEIRAAKHARTLALAAMAAAVAAENPVAFTIAQKALHVADHTLKVLKTAQFALLAKAQFEMNSGVVNARKALQAVWFIRNRSRSTLAGAQGVVLPGSPAHLAVRVRDPEDPNPEYVPESDFSQRQALQVSWRVHLNRSEEKTPWIKQDWRLERACGATLVEEPVENSFKAKLIEAKSSSKSSFFF